MLSSNPSQLEEYLELREQYDYLLAHIHAARENIEEVYRIKECIANEDMAGAAGWYGDLDRATQLALWRATTKGGIWTTEERRLMSADGEVSRLIAQAKKAEAV
jgi:hypothetical protein